MLALALVVLRICGSGVEFETTTNNLLDGAEEVLLGSDLSAGTNGKHTGLGCDGSQFSTS